MIMAFIVSCSRFEEHTSICHSSRKPSLLDAAVFAAYGWPLDLTDEEAFRNLLELDLEVSYPRQERRHQTRRTVIKEVLLCLLAF